MDFQIIPVLSHDEVDRFFVELERATFVDGKATASGVAREVKHNLQADRSGAQLTAMDNTIYSALRASKEFQAFAQPKRILAPSYSRYEPGMEYGAHVDGAIMGGAQPMRADLAMTIFLSAPDSYDGGELVIDLPFGEQQIKLPAGEAVVYPASSLHHVAPITRGVRMAAVTWIQSAVRDERLRAILADLGQAVNSAEAAQDKAATVLLSKCYHNLLRYAADL
jgi:PKHD-type hydroxylase